MLNLFRAKTFLKEYKKIRFTDKLYTKYVVYISTLLKERALKLIRIGSHSELFN